MNIGEIAALAGVPAATVRYYERRGLIATVPRSRSGYRQYGPETARRLRFIKHAQELGFSLEEIQELLALRVSNPASCARVEATTRHKLAGVRHRIRELVRMERVLEDLVRSCEAKRPTDECPVLAVLAEEAQHDVAEHASRSMTSRSMRTSGSRGADGESRTG
jgi:Hg(II)-responsive transcriptional regulator